MRKQSREAAFKIIYKSLFGDDLSCEEILEEENISKQEDVEFVSELINLYSLHKEEINNNINASLVGYTPDRVYRIYRAILCNAITEIFYYKKTPFKVVVNEAVEMAKKYSTEKSYSFVNGMLKKITEGQNVV